MISALLLALLSQMPGVQLYQNGSPVGQAYRVNCAAGVSCTMDGGVGQIRVGLGVGLTSDGGSLSSTDTCTGSSCNIGNGGIYTDGGVVISRLPGTGAGLQIISTTPDIAIQINNGSTRIVDGVGYCFGGYESCWGPFGGTASAQGHAVDLFQTQSNNMSSDGVTAGITIYANDTDAGQVATRVGGFTANTNAKLLQVCTNAGPSSCTEQASISGTGSMTLAGSLTAPGGIFLGGVVSIIPNPNQLWIDAPGGLQLGHSYTTPVSTNALLSSSVASGSDSFKLLDGAYLNFSTSDLGAKLYRNQTNTIASLGSFKVGSNELGAASGSGAVVFVDDGDVRAGHLKFTLPYTAFVAAACTQTIKVATFPAGAIVTGAWMETTIDYNSGHMNLSLGINTSLADFLTATDMRFPLVRGLVDADLATNFQRANRIQNGLMESWTASNDLAVGASNCGFAGGNFGNGTVTNYAQGSTTFWVTYELVK